MKQKSKPPAIHPKWLALVVLVVIGYGLLQPVLSSKWGWNLPSLASLVSEQSSTTGESKPVRDTASPEPSGLERQSSAGGPGPEQATNGDNESGTIQSTSSASDLDHQEELLHGLLREIRPSEFVSPVGLRYTRGSEQGHRLDHLARHLKDQSDRPGRHGVFHGDMRQVLKWLDEAYDRASRDAEGTRKREEEGRTVVEVTFAAPIGFIGGREGKRQGHPKSNRLRLVLDGDRVITAFPF